MTSKNPKVLFVCTEDWFFHSHFLPLNETALSIEGCETTIVCNSGEFYQDFQRAGLNVIPLDFSRSNTNLLPLIKLVWRLFIIFRKEKPDFIHFIALKPIILGGMASLLNFRSKCVYHLTGLGYFTVSQKKRDKRIRHFFLKLICWYLKQKNSWLLLENSDDYSALKKYGKIPQHRFLILGGAGVDTQKLVKLPDPENEIPTVAFVGRMVWSKGVDILIKAMDLLKSRRVKIKLNLYGAIDENNPRSILRSQLDKWDNRDDVDWHGYISDVKEVWQEADICVVPSRGGEGLPRALLEAAAYGRPLLVTDVPGCRTFVRNGIEGIIAPPEDPYALSLALEKLVSDQDLREKMGQAARMRVLDGYTEKHLRDKVRNLYIALLKK